MLPDQKRAYYRAYNARRETNYYQEAKTDPEKWARVLAARAKSDKTRRDKALENPVAWVRHNTKQTSYRAKREGIPFDLDAELIAVPTHCPVLGVLLSYTSRGRSNDGASFDRIEPSLGYVNGNVRIISRRANRIRQDCTDPAVFDALAADARRLQCRRQ